MYQLDTRQVRLFLWTDRQVCLMTYEFITTPINILKKTKPQETRFCFHDLLFKLFLAIIFIMQRVDHFVKHLSSNLLH